MPRYKTRAEITVFDGTPIWYGFCAGAKAIRYGVIKALIVASGIFVTILGSHTLDVKFAILFFAMATQFCNQELAKLAQVANHHAALILTYCVLNLIFALVTSLGNILVICAIWNASSIPSNVKKLLLSLAFSDLLVGVILQLMHGVITGVIRTEVSRDKNYDFLCPTVLTICYFLTVFLAGASFLTIIAIAVDRLLAISLHLRYRELVTSNCVVIALVSVWLASGVTSSIYVSLHNNKELVVAIVQIVGLILTTVVYIHIYRVVKQHQNQIHCQHRFSNTQATELLRERKSVFNALIVYVVFLACYFPYLCLMILITASGPTTATMMAEMAALFVVFLNSMLNPFIYCWRYQEIKESVKSVLKKIIIFQALTEL